MSTDPQWNCAAYGPEGLEHGALCFAAPELGQRVCRTAYECERLVAGERQRVHRRIQELAAAGDPTAEYLAREFTNPNQLLGGSGTPPGVSDVD